MAAVEEQAMAADQATISARPFKGAKRLLGRLADVLEMIKFSHTLFALPFALFGAVLAAHEGGRWTIRPLDVVGILACMVTARSAAMAFNRLADRRFDADNPRTASRHLPSGRISARFVAGFTAASALGFIASTCLFLPRNPWPLSLSIPVLAWLLAYSYTKRWTSFAHFWLGASLALAPVAAWIAIRGSLGWPVVWLGLGVLFWVAGFDILYASQDVDFDRRARLQSIPARIGVAGALRLAALCHIAMLAMMAALAISYPLGWVYWLGLAAIASLLIYEHSLVRPGDLARVNTAFFHMNILISTVTLLAGTTDLLLRGFSR
jgi:4-hydroxybenzoate polyprenyltransferase